MTQILALLCFAAVAVVFIEATPTTPAPLVRCKRPQNLCMQFCENGHKTDECGHPRCECLEDPCEDETTCTEGKQCLSEPSCPAHQSNCERMDHTCQEVPMCAEPMCANPCEHYKKNKYGCMTCECAENACDGHVCAEGHTCIESAPHLPFFHTDHQKICLPDLHLPDFMNRFPTHPVGFEPDDFTSVCELRKELMEELKSQVTEQESPMPGMLMDSLGHEVSCDDSGAFTPTQCNPRINTCWCVNNVGMEVRNSRVHVKEGDSQPECEVYRTTKVDISMVLTHSFDNLDEHMDGIKQAVVERLSGCLETDVDYIQVKQMQPHKEQHNLLRVVVTVVHNDDETDLSLVAERFKFNAKKTPYVIQCHGQDLTVDGKSVTVQHTSKPESQVDYEDSGEVDAFYDDDDLAYKCSRIWREHKGLVVVAGIGGVVFFLLILAVIVAACKRKARARAQFQHGRMDTYKENLAYQNEVYSQGVPDDKEKDVKVLGMEYGKEGQPMPKY